jgi:hypothetical protein
MRNLMKNIRLAGLALGAAGLLTVGGLHADWGLVKDAEAVIGRPATPGSYAGVARRTSRRTVARTTTAYAAPAGMVATLPAGCVRSGSTYVCGTVRYRTYYNGPNLVYVPL